MANKKYEEADIQAIATTIREKTGTDKLYDTSEMASGVNEVYEAGKTKERSDFWDDYLSFQQGYNLAYWFAGGGWKKSNFKPTKDFYVCSQMFYCHNYANGENSYDLATHLEELGVKITHVFNTRDAFYSSRFTRIPELDCTDISQNATTYRTFFECAYLVTIDKIIIDNDGSRLFDQSFYKCNQLKNIKFEGVIGQTISFSSSPLSVESMKSIITHLKNYAGVTDTSGNSLEMKYTLTLKDSCRTELEAASFTDEDKRVLEANGIVFTDETTWASVIGDLKWNLVWATA